MCIIKHQEKKIKTHKIIHKLIKDSGNPNQYYMEIAVIFVIKVLSHMISERSNYYEI